MNRYFISGCLGLAVFFSCSKKEVFYEFRSFPQAEWDQQEVVRFEVPVHDNSILYDVFLEIRNNNNYSFRNLWLFVDYESFDRQLRSDTVYVELADIYGKWYGKGISIYNYSFPYELNVQYSDTGRCVYTVRQGMRENPLKGISDIGLKISKKSDQ
ncbi:MAG: gliding motility lipoprotein GldH [Dysgonamonadaceae bacterium]|jgi:gliding motility-associated lipoprotein GldH|nr:gliding motility lipoprotein GldH [Dysgonamonadaceae bacterium]